MRKARNLSDFPFHVVLYEPEIPQNTGNIARTCVAVGAKLWLVRPLGFQLDEKNLRRPGLDYWQHLNWQDVDDWKALGLALGPRPLWFFTKRATRLYTDVEYRRGDALVFGSESQGLPSDLRDSHADRCLRMPIRPEVRSLNLANSVAVAVYEALRQCRNREMRETNERWPRGS